MLSMTQWQKCKPKADRSRPKTFEPLGKTRNLENGKKICLARSTWFRPARTEIDGAGAQESPISQKDKLNKKNATLSKKVLAT
jgi:hypothetical protein